MMIKESLRHSFLAARPAATAMLSVRSAQFTGNVKKLDEKEKGDELLYFKKQEGKQGRGVY